MIGKNSPQIDVFTQMMYDKLIPKDHLLVKIDSIIDFSFVYDKVKGNYSEGQGRSSKDPAMMVKIILLEYLYNLSDVEVAKRAATDVVFRWFLGLSLDDKVPDDTTISHFRVKRLGKEKFEEFFNEIVRLCIDKNLVKANRFIIDTTDVAVNASLPFGKKLVRDAYRKVIRQVEFFNESLAAEFLESFENEIALRSLSRLYVKTHEELESNPDYQEAFRTCYDIADYHFNHPGRDSKLFGIRDFQISEDLQ